MVQSVISQTYDFKEFSVSQGLPQSQVTSIFEDSRGFLWVGTLGGGVSKFDGLHFKNYTTKEGLGGNLISGIAEDRNGNLWFSSNAGLTKFNGNDFVNFTSENHNVPRASIMDVVVDDKNQVYAATDNGVYLFKNDKLVSHILKDSSIYVNDLFIDSKDNIWISTFSGIYILKKTSTIHITKENGLISNEITCVIEDEKGDYIIGTHFHGMQKLLQGSVDEKYQFVFNDLAPNIKKIKDLHLDKENTIWASTAKQGIFKIKDNKTQQLSKQNGLPVNDINLVYEDRVGNMWIGSTGAGLVKFGSEAFTYFQEFNGLNSNGVFSVIQNKKGQYLIGTKEDGIFIFDGNKNINITEINGKTITEIYSSVVDLQGNIWFTCGQGLIKYNGGFTLYTEKNGVPSSFTKGISLDKEGNIWFGAFGVGLVKYDFKNFTLFSRESGDVTSNYIHSLFKDKDGELWIGTGNGINKYSNGKFVNFRNNKGLCDTYIGCIDQDNFGNMWFGTGKCLVKYDGVDFKPYTSHEGLSSDLIYLIHYDNHSNLWVGTNNGLDKISFNTYGQIQNIKNYNIESGFKGIESNSRAVFEDTEENIWFGTVNGLVKYNPKKDVENVFEPKAYINNLKLYFEDVDWPKYTQSAQGWSELPKDLKLDHSENHLTFEYSAVSLSSPELLNYTYILEPVDKDWFPISKRKSVTYSNLAPGEYTFKVRAVNQDNVWSQTPASFHFEIEAPFWQKWWFYLLLTLVLGYVLFSIIIIREKRQKKISNELEKKVKERTAIIEKQHDEKEILLKEIHHRVKNNLQIIISLLSIQSNYTKDPEALALFDEAKNRIRSMSIIHEKMYRTGDLAHIDVQDYIVALTNELVSTYSINCDIFLDIDIEDIKLDIDTIIPIGLLLNEIVSNSLKYAFQDKDSGKITIHLKKQDNDFLLVLGDDGIGVPDDFLEDHDDSSLGIVLISVFVEQLDGEITRLKQPGSIFGISFKERRK